MMVAAVLVAAGLCSCGPENPYGRPTQPVRPVEPAVDVVPVPDATPPAAPTQPSARPSLLDTVAPDLIESPDERPLAPATGGGPSLPQSAPASAPGPRPLSERQGVVDRRAVMVRDPERRAWVVRFASPDGGQEEPSSMPVLPSGWLASMEEEVARYDPQVVQFRVSGEITRYRGRNFLMVRSAAIEALQPPGTTGPLPQVGAAEEEHTPRAAEEAAGEEVTE